VYRRNSDGTRTYLGATPNDAYFVPQLDRAGTESTTAIEVEAVSAEYGRSAAATTTHAVSTTARYVRLVVTRPTQNTAPATRIYEFEAWGE
jgi:mannosyl-glycoprotein endo-beta-N-acetylglucosaminidase